MKKAILAGIVLLFVAVLWAGFCLAVFRTDSALAPIIDNESPSVKEKSEKTTVVIDPGHGGMDSGAVGVSGTLEKDLTLSYALTLKRFLEEENVCVVLTRTEDEMLSHEGKTGKTADLTERLSMTRQADLFISLHMNKFGDSSVKGITVYYSGNNEESRKTAEKLKEGFLTDLPEGGNRPIKKADSSIFLLYRTTVPAVLVECGFLSNPTEEALLKTDEYRDRICMSVKNTIVDILENSRKEEGQ